MAGSLFLFAAWLVPLHFLPWPSWHSEVVAFVAALAFLFVLHRRDPDLKPAQVPQLALVPTAFGIAVLLQAATGLISLRGDAVVIGLYVALCIAALICGYAYEKPFSGGEHGQNRNHGDLLKALAWTLFLGAVASSAVALVQVFDLWGNVGWVTRAERLRRPGGNLGQPNHLGTLVLMGTASLLYLRECGKLSGAASISSFFLLALGLSATESRTGLIGLTLLSIWALIGIGRSELRTSRVKLAIGAAAASALFFAWPALMSSIDMFEEGAVVDAKPGLRLVVWPQLLEASLMKPWFGWGVRQVSEAHNAVASAYPTGEPYTYAHNLVIELALGVGWPLTLLFVGASSVWLWRRLRAARTPATWYCVAAVLPVAVHSGLEFPYAYAYFLLPTMLLLGVLERLSGGLPIKRLPARALALPLLVAIALGAWTVVEYLDIEEDFRVARFEASKIGNRPAGYEMPRVQLLTQLDVLLNGARIVPRQGMSDAEIELARQAALRYPWPATQNRYALSLALNGSRSEALRQLQVMKTLHGRKKYEEIRASWDALAAERYPSLADLAGRP